MGIEIGKYAPGEEEEFTNWYEFREGFEIEVKYLSPKKWRKLLEQSTIKKKEWDARHRPQMVRDFDTDKFVENIGKVIVNWKGLTPEILRSIVVLDVEALKKDMKEQGIKEIPFSKPSLMHLLNNARGDFIDFLTDVTLEIEEVQFKCKKEELKNLSSSSGGGKTR